MPSLEMWLIAGQAVFLLFSCALAVAACNRWRRTAQSQSRQLLACHDVILQRIADLEARVDTTNAHIAQLAEHLQRQQPPLAATPAAPASPGYQIAIRLAKSGASRDELISGCGLSISEAELVHRLHSPNGKTAGRKPRATAVDGATNQSRVA